MISEITTLLSGGFLAITDLNGIGLLLVGILLVQINFYISGIENNFKKTEDENEN